MFGAKSRTIERLRKRLGDVSDERDVLRGELSDARATERRTAELYVRADTDAMVTRAEAEGLAVALLAEHGRAERYRAAWQSARRRAAIVQFCDRVPFLPECQDDAAEPCDHGEGGCPVVVCHIGNRDELADVIRAAALYETV